VAKAVKLFSVKDGAYMTRLTLSSFRSKVSKLGIKATKKGREVFYTRQQLEDVHNGVPLKKGKPVKAKKPSKAKR
jgi:hypothetical protein